MLILLKDKRLGFPRFSAKSYFKRPHQKFSCLLKLLSAEFQIRIQRALIISLWYKLFSQAIG
jgi:hypothetical protein